jgi:hypothetical protein
MSTSARPLHLLFKLLLQKRSRQENRWSHRFGARRGDGARADGHATNKLRFVRLSDTFLAIAAPCVACHICLLPTERPRSVDYVPCHSSSIKCCYIVEMVSIDET